MQTSNDPIDSIVRELIIFRQSGRLRKDAVPRAKELLTDLRQRGYTPEMIEEMTQGLWRVSIIKHYTVGVHTDPSSQEPRETLAILTDFVKSGLTLERANQAVAINKTIDSEGASLEQVAELTATASNSELGIAGVVSDVVKARKSGILIEELGQTLNYKKSLEAMGINDERLGKLNDIVTNQGQRNFDDTVKFMNKFNGAEALDSYIDQRTATTNHLDAEVNSRRSEIQNLRIDKESIQGSLDLYARLQERGFTESVLAKLEQSSQIYGGPDNVLEAINQFGGLRHLYGAAEKARVDAKAENASLELLKAKHLGFAHAIGMCNELMQKGYDTSTIERIHHVAGSYGTPNEVLRAVDEYGSLGAIYMGHEKARDYDRVKQALDEEKVKTAHLEQKTADYEQVKKDKEEVQSKLADQDKKSIKILEDVLVQLENPPDQRRYDEELANSGIPELLEKRLDDVVAKRVREADNDVLKRRFADEARSQIQRYLGFWPNSDFGTRTSEKVRLLAQLDQANPFVVLRGEWLIQCNKCEDSHKLKLNGVRDIKELLVKERIRFYDTSIYALLGKKHSIDVSLKDVVSLYLRKALRNPEADTEII